MSKPLVSVVIPSYNRADYVPMTLDSVLAQSFEDFELVFIDDGSTDQTKEIVEAYAQKDSRVKYFHQENSERAVARSYGISLAQGKYICLVDSDDLWYPEKLAEQLKVMEEHPHVVLCYASVNRIDFDNERVQAAARQQQGSSGYVFEDLLMRNFIPSVTPMIRAEVAKNIGSQVTEFIPYEDWDFWLRISKEGEFYHIEKPLGDYRLHPGQSVKNVNAEKIEEVTIKVLDANTGSLHQEDTSKANGLSNTQIQIGDEMASDGFANKDIAAEIVDEAYSQAYLRIAYWYILANKAEIAREKLQLSMSRSSKRKLDYRWHALYMASFSQGVLNPLLASLH